MPKETIEVMGVKLPLYQDCNTCHAVKVCKFGGYIYDQPCKKCKSEEAYEKEMAYHKEETDKQKRINESLVNQVPMAVHEYRGRYLYTNRRGDIMKDEKIRPMKRGEKWKKT